MIGGIRQLLPDVSTDELSLIVSPLSVLKTWYNTFHSWTTYKDKIVMIDHQSKLTADVMKTAKVVLITYAEAILLTCAHTHTHVS